MKRNLKEGNALTNTLPPSLDQFLMDVCQCYETITYADVSKFGEIATGEDIKKLRNFYRRWNYAGSTDYEEGMEKVAREVGSFVKSRISNKVQESHKKSMKESSGWNRETDPISREAFDVVFNLFDKHIVDTDTEDEDAAIAANNDFAKKALQGMYHAIEQFSPAVEDLMDADIIFSKDPIFFSM